MKKLINRLFGNEPDPMAQTAMQIVSVLNNLKLTKMFIETARKKGYNDLANNIEYELKLKSNAKQI